MLSEKLMEVLDSIQNGINLAQEKKLVNAFSGDLGVYGCNHICIGGCQGSCSDGCYHSCEGHVYHQ